MANELKIKMTLDDTGVDQKLDQFGSHANRAAVQARDAMGRFTKEGQQAAGAVDSMRSGLGGVNDQLATLIKAQVGLSAIKGAGAAIGEEFRRAADYTKQVAQQFADVRQALQQVAALRGESNTNKFAIGQVEEAAKAGLTPEEWVKAQEEFQSRAGAYLEGDQARLNQTQGADFQQRIASFAKARGIAPAEAMSLGGGLLQFSEGQQDVGDLMGRYGRVFKTLERAPTPVSQLLPQMSRLMSQGFSPEESAQALAIQSEANPGEEQVYAEAALRDITKARLEGKGEELGLKKGMTPLQQIEAASRALKKRIDAGEDADEVLKPYTEDIRGRRGLLGFINRGVKSSGFERVRGYAAETPDDFTSKAVEDYEKSDEGRAARRRANKALAEARIGYREQSAKEQLELAEGEMTREELKNRPFAANVYRGGVGLFTGVSAEDQVKNEIAIRNLRLRARGLGVSRDSYGAFQGDERQGVSTNDVQYRSQQSVNEEIRDLLKIIADEAKKQGRQVDPSNQVPPPMPATPAPRPARVN